MGSNIDGLASVRPAGSVSAGEVINHKRTGVRNWSIISGIDLIADEAMMSGEPKLDLPRGGAINLKYCQWGF